MGNVVSATSRGNGERRDEDTWQTQHQILAAKLDFFRNWRIEDVEYVLGRLRAMDRLRPGEAHDSATGEAKSGGVISSSSAEQTKAQVDFGVYLEWHEVFDVVLHADIERQQSTRERRQWHIAARGYAMIKDGQTTAQLDQSPLSEVQAAQTFLAPGHTDDEASDDDDQMEQSEQSMSDDESAVNSSGHHHGAHRGTRTIQGAAPNQRAGLPSGYDAAVVSPVFFGYTFKTEADVDTARAKERALRDQEEARIIQKQRARRTCQLAQGRENALKRREARERTLAAIDADFERGRKQRTMELQTAKKVMTADEYAPVLKQWNTDEVSITQAHESELSDRKRKFAFLNREDTKDIQNVANSAKYAEKVENSKVPRGAQLEALARGEIERLVGEVDVANESVKQTQDELLAAQNLRGKKEGARARQVVETSLILLEGRAASSDRQLDSLLESLREAEFMLQRAQRIRSQENLVLPLYEPLAKNADEGDFRVPFFSVLAALAVACNDTMWEKLTFITQLFDVDDSKFLDKDEICTLLATLGRVLNSLKLLQVKTSAEELESIVMRAFLEAHLDYRKGMTTYEVKSWMAGVVARSQKLSNIFGANWTFGQMSTVMRCKMSMVHEFELGMISMVDLKHKVARALIKPQKCLQKDNVQGIHDRAVAMGDSDPLKPDYSRFLRSGKKTAFSNAIPLRHGHLENYSHWRDVIGTQAVTKIQNIFRGKLARKAAESIAKKHAFFCARAVALHDTRQRITADIWKREAASGVGRLKWDAKVRMKQAKLRAAGGNMDRQEVVEAIIAASVEAAQDGVMQRFDEIAKERGFHEGDVDQVLEQALAPADNEEDFLMLASASSQTGERTKAACRHMATRLLKTDVLHLAGRFMDIGKETIVDLGLPQTPRKEGDGHLNSTLFPNTALALAKSGVRQSVPGASAPMADGVCLLPSTGTTRSLRQAVELSSVMITMDGQVREKVDLADARKQLMIMGLFPAQLYGAGESFEEMRLRRRLADADPPVEELSQRIRNWDVAMTRLKTDQLLTELPTKRLLMKYAQGFVDRAEPSGNLQALFDDLARHFQIHRNADQVGAILVNLVRTDFDFGLAVDALNILRGNQDTLLAKMTQLEVANGMSEAEGNYTRRLNAAKSQGRTIAEAEEMNNRKTFKEVKKRQQSIAEAHAMMSRGRARLVTAEQELSEIRRRDANDRALKRRADGLPIEAQIKEAHRYDWARRYTAATEAAEESEETLEAKYVEISNVCSDFVETAKHLATTIIDERNIAMIARTIQPVIEGDCHGRGVEGNRGEAGKTYKYEAFNIRLKVCCDDHGLFNGDDECAAKGYGGREVLGSLEYMKQHQPGVVIPLTCVVDYHGFRVLAVAKVPISTPIFTKSGKLRRTREDLVHGTPDAGGTILNENRILNSKLRAVAEKLNLSLHTVKGLRELNTTALWASADLRAYRKERNTFYLLKFWRAFPPEDPTATPHLKPSGRGQSVLWRGLRPELVRSNPVPLSPDANMLVTHNAPDWRQQRDDVLEATRRLVHQVIPSFAEELCRKEFGSPGGASGSGFSLTDDMHRRGISVRHMGLLRDMFWRPLEGKVDLSFNSNRVRTRTDMRLQLRRGDQVRIDGSVFTISAKMKHEFSASAITLDRKVERISRNNVTIYKGKVGSDRNSPEIRRLLLAEMVARATKNNLRHLLRTSSTQCHATTCQTQLVLTVESINVVTGSHERSHYFWNERILPSIRSRFGELAVDHAEELNIRLVLQPFLVYIVQRLQEMLGFTLSTTCASHFFNRPCGFRFTTLDISSAPLRIKHNAPMKEVADASVLVLRANKARATAYIDLIQMAQPELYLTLQERKGSRVAVNHGKGGIAISGYFVGPIRFERPGPISNDPLNRAVHLQPSEQCYIDTKQTGKLVVPMHPRQPFSVECWAKCEGGLDTTRYVVMTGRYSILATRENVWAVSVCTEDGSELHILGPKVVHGEWVYLVTTYDGVVIRMFVDTELVAQVELNAALERARSEKKIEQEKALTAIQEEEDRARDRCKAASEKELNIYLKTREGEAKLSRAAHKLREKAEFAWQMDRDAAGKGMVRMSKADSKAHARFDLKTEIYMRNVQKVAQEFKRKRDDLQDLAAQEREEILELAEKPLRVGAMCRSKRSMIGRNFFHGDLCHVAVYLSALPVDTIRAHHFAGVKASAFESDRLYALAGAKFRAALASAPDDTEIVARYAQSIINYLELESTQIKNPRRSQGLVEEAVDTFVRMENWDGLAILFAQLPSAPLYAGSFCRAFLATVEAVPDYFASSLHMPLKNLAHMPKKFYLDLAGAGEMMTEVAASVYRLVLTDLSLADIFGQVDLSWLPVIKSAPTVVATVLQAESDEDERVIDLEKYQLDCSNVEEADLMALIDHRRLAVVLNLTGCRRVTDRCMQHVAQVLVHLQALTLSRCQLITDQHFDRIVRRNTGLTVLGLSRCPAIGPLALAQFPRLCTGLQTVDLSHNANVTDAVLDQLAKSCRRLESLYLQYCAFITDAGVQMLAVEVNHDTLTSLDLSGCALLSDHSAVALGQLCRKLRRLNLKAVNRVTEVGGRSITHNCWDLEYLCLEDMYNLMDSAFVFDFSRDGRRAVEANMLRCVTDMNLQDCNKLTDTAVDHVMKRACRISTLNLAGCCNLTDMACSFIVRDSVTGSRRGAFVTSLNLGYCMNITDQGLVFLTASLTRLRHINLAGCVQLSDEGVLALVSICTRLQDVVLAQCKHLTDKSLCYLADFLWVEALDVSHCSKISDDGIEVLALEFGGLHSIGLKRCFRLTERALTVLGMYCPHLKQVDLQHLPNCSQTAIDRLKRECPGVDVVV